MSRPVVPDEQPPASVDSRLKSYLSRMYRYCRVALDNLYDWTVEHVKITAPLYEEDPHEQYWHVINDSAGSHMWYQDYVTGKPVAENAVITGYDFDVHTTYHTISDLVAGTITMPATTAGLYNVYYGVAMEGTANSTYFIQAFKNGVASPLALPIVLKGTLTTGNASYSGMIVLDPSDVIDLRVTGSGGAVINQVNFGVVRYLSTEEFDTGIQNNLGGPPTLPSNYGQGGMP